MTSRSTQASKLTAKQRQVVAAIRDLHRKDEPLNISAMKRRHPELIEAAYAVKPFWGWKRAIDAAGLDYRRIRVELEPYVTCRICGEEYSSLPMHVMAAHGATMEDYLADYPGADIMSEDLRARKTRLLSGLNRRPRAGAIPHWEPIWTPEYVLDRLWEYYSRGYLVDLPSMLRTESRLVAVAKTRFGTHFRALRCLGLEDRFRLRAERRQISRQDVMGRIAARARAGKHLNYVAMISEVPDWGQLLTAAKRHFGSWRNAVKAAGYVLPKLVPAPCRGPNAVPDGGFPDRQSVIAAIRKHASAGLPLRYISVSRELGDSVLFWRRVRALFGTWFRALMAAGYKDAAQTRRGRTFRYSDRESVLAAIRQRARDGLPLRSTAVCRGTTDRDSGLVAAGSKLFGGWSRALTAAGFSDVAEQAASVRRPRYPDAKSVLAGIRKRARAGLSLRYSRVSHGAGGDYALIRDGSKFFGGWPRALVAAGFKRVAKGAGPRYPDGKSVLAGIRKRARAGLSLRSAMVEAGPDNRDANLVRWGRGYYGSWSKALLAAGCKKEAEAVRFGSAPRYPDRKSVLAGIRKRARAGLSLRHMAVSKPGHGRDLPLLFTAKRIFGSWPKALVAAGLEKELKAFRFGPPPLYPDRESVLTAIRKRASAGLSLRCRAVREGKSGSSALTETARRLFGGWRDALVAAGYEPCSLGIGPRYQTKGAVLAGIRKRQRAGLSLRYAQACHGEDADRSLLRATERLFGGWRKALAAARLQQDASGEWRLKRRRGVR